MDEPSADADAGFLPPKPSGPQPDLGGGAEARGQGPASGYAPPAHAQPSYPPPGAEAASPQAGFGQPAAWQQGGQWAQPAPVPDNGPAIAGLVLSISAIALLLFSVGLSTIISLGCAALGVYYSRQGRSRVDRGETPKHRGVAQAGFVVGIVALVLSALATVFWTIFAILYATDEGFRDDLEDDLDGDGDSPDGFETSLKLGVAALRLVACLLR